MDTLARLDALHAFYDGVIPDPIREAVIGRDLVAYLQAVGNVKFYREMVTGQVSLIRKRRADGSFVPYMLDDLRLYVRGWRLWRRETVRFGEAVEQDRDAA